jgi:hypothetical protein
MNIVSESIHERYHGFFVFYVNCFQNLKQARDCRVNPIATAASQHNECPPKSPNKNGTFLTTIHDFCSEKRRFKVPEGT